MKINKLITIIAFILIPAFAHADVWYPVGSPTHLTPVVPTWGLQLPSLTSKNCLGTDSSGNVQVGSCSGGGGSGGGTWATTTSAVPLELLNYSLNNSDIVLVGGSSTSTAKFIFDPNSLIGYIAGLLGIGTKSPTYPLDVVGLGHFTGLVDAQRFVATSSLASSFPNASTTNINVSGSTYLTALSQGQLNVGAGGQLYSGATTTFSTGLSYSNGIVTNTAPDQTVALSNGTGISVTGTYPNFTITNTSPSSGGTVTGTGLTGMMTSWSSNSAITSTSTVVAAQIFATSTASSTFTGGIDAKTICLQGTTTCLSPGGTGSSASSTLLTDNNTFSGVTKFTNSSFALSFPLSISSGGLGLNTIGASSTVLMSNGTSNSYKTLSPGNFTTANISQWTNDSGYLTIGTLPFTYPFPLSGNATGTVTGFNAGLTIGNNTGIVLGGGSGNDTTIKTTNIGDFLIQTGTNQNWLTRCGIDQATKRFAVTNNAFNTDLFSVTCGNGIVVIPNTLSVGSTTATSTFANGIEFTGGTIKLDKFPNCNGTFNLETDSSGNISCGADASSTILTDNNTFSGVTQFTNIGTSTFTGRIGVTSASTTATSTFAGINLPYGGCFAVAGSCITGGSGGSGTVTSVATNNGLTGGTITNTGTIGLDISALSSGALDSWNGTRLAATGTQALTAGYYIATTSIASQLPYASSTAVTASGQLSVGSTTPTSNLIFSVGSTTPSALTVNGQSGYLGFGTSTPEAPITFAVTSSLTRPDFIIDGQGTGQGAEMELNRSSNANTEGVIDFNTNGVNIWQLGLQNNSSDDFELWDGNDTPIYTVNKATNDTGIGTTTASAELTVWGDTTQTDTTFNVVTSASSTSFAVVNNGRVGVGTTSPGSLFAINGVMNFTTATSSGSSTGGIDMPNGCYAIRGTCIGATGGGGSGTVNTGLTGEVPYYAANGTTLTASSSASLTMGSFFGTSTVPSYFQFASTTGLTSLGSAYLGTNGSRVAIGTTTPLLGSLTLSSTNGGSLTLSDGAGVNGWSFKTDNAGNLTISTTTVQGTATSTPPAMQLNSAGSNFGFGTSSPYAYVSITTNPGFIGDAFNIATSSSGRLYTIDSVGHQFTSGSAGTCDANCTFVSGDDNSFYVKTGTAITSTVVTFANSWGGIWGPTCFVGDGAAITTFVDASSTPTSVTLTPTTALTGTILGISCFGHR